MDRRKFLSMLGYASASLALPISNMSHAAEFVPHTGQLFLTVQAGGGWDVSSFCDPKVNTADTVINNWAVGMTADDLPKAGNIPYAPFANNAAFFERFSKDMLVINGVDMQTNSHRVGVMHAWSGRTSVGFPSMTALFAHEHGSALPVSYLNFGGYAETAGLIRYSRIDKVSELRSVLEPNVNGNSGRFYAQSDVNQIVAAQQARLEKMKASDGLLPRQKSAMEAYYSARPNTVALEQFASVIPDDSLIENSKTLFQAQIAILGFKAGVTCAADIDAGGFDSHQNNDNEQTNALTNLTELLTYIWDYAQAQGVADRLTIMVGSDFARTPYYNNSDGKNHWPVGSYMMMRKDATWGNRVINASDANQNALALNPDTLLVDGEEGSTTLHPMHIHSALRNELGLSSSGFAFSNSQEFDFFNAGLG
ncbi:MAG: DUF1501 domain-containing protein [Bermanella sp.]